MWKNRRVLVTGATGLLGGHLVEKLLEEGSEVTAIVRDFVPHSRYNLLPLPVNEVYGDIENFDYVSRTINEYQIQTVFHLAAQTQVRVANVNPLPTMRTNIMGTVNILEAARINKVNHVIVASIDKAYGASKVLPYDEGVPLRGSNPYDVSKSCADLLAQSYRKTYGMDIGITRCGNLFGPGDLNFDRLIPYTIRQLLEDEPVIIRSDGTMIRDYFYVKDAVHAYMCLAERVDHLHSSENYIYNFSYGQPMTVLQVVKFIAKLMGVEVLPRIQDQANNEIQEQHLDSSLAWNELKWEPIWTMGSALQQTIQWYKENL